MHRKLKIHFLEYIFTLAENLKKDIKPTTLIFLVSLIFILLSEDCYSFSFKTLQNKIRKNEICEIDYNSSKTAAIVNVDCGSASYVNFKTKKTYRVVKHWSNVGSEWLTDDLAYIAGPCGTGCSQSIIFIAPATSISCPIHEYRITSLSQDEPPDFYNNNPLLIEPRKKIYVCYSEGNNIQVFKFPKQLKRTIIPPEGYYSQEAIIRKNQLIILYKNAKGKLKRISYGNI